jgi:hypothetical protein
MSVSKNPEPVSPEEYLKAEQLSEKNMSMSMAIFMPWQVLAPITEELQRI